MKEYWIQLMTKKTHNCKESRLNIDFHSLIRTKDTFQVLSRGADDGDICIYKVFGSKLVVNIEQLNLHLGGVAGASYINPTESGGFHLVHVLEWPFYSQGIFSDINARRCTPRLPNNHTMVHWHQIWQIFSLIRAYTVMFSSIIQK